MERMAERHDEVGDAAGRQHPFNFPDNLIGTGNVFENRIALHALEQSIAERKMMRIGSHGYSGEAEQIHVHVSIHERPATSDVKVPPSQGDIQPFSGVHHKRVRRR